ncbi:MarR family winged helix-turn-helix transcriptional regulator [Sinomonas terrae]|uniref:MarR family transcriptional regulator n=1 Tax=Sinomonas terrae TaxID=2908838 RepID=A0ABS9U3W6_9MICC|nr:MarR family transcriptional regulator [Sinomonas terrae]MCH6471379.1 MarR family transcriptional regulator [Sinomonas terrae]
MPVEPQTVQDLIHNVLDLQRVLRCIAHDRRAADVGTAEAGVLRMISEFGGRAVDIAEKLNVSPPVLSRHIAELQERGLVARRRDPEDRRAQLLELTEAGKAKLAEVEEARISLLLDMLKGWDEADAATCKDLVGRLTETIREAAHSGPLKVTHPLDTDPEQKEEALAAR